MARGQGIWRKLSSGSPPGWVSCEDAGMVKCRYCGADGLVWGADAGALALRGKRRWMASGARLLFRGDGVQHSGAECAKRRKQRDRLLAMLQARRAAAKKRRMKGVKREMPCDVPDAEAALIRRAQLVAEAASPG